MIFGAVAAAPVRRSPVRATAGSLVRGGRAASVVEVVPATARAVAPGMRTSQKEAPVRRFRMIGTAVAIAALAGVFAAPAAHACPEEPCNAPAPDPTHPVFCVVYYEGPIKGIGSCFDPRP